MQLRPAGRGALTPDLFPHWSLWHIEGAQEKLGDGREGAGKGEEREGGSGCFPSGSAVKNLSSDVGDTGSLPGQSLLTPAGEKPVQR